MKIVPLYQSSNDNKVEAIRNFFGFACLDVTLLHIFTFASLQTKKSETVHQAKTFPQLGFKQTLANQQQILQGVCDVR